MSSEETAYLVGVGITGADQLLVGVKQHPQLRLVLRLVQQVAKQRAVGGHFPGLVLLERVGRLKGVDLTIVRH